MCVSQKNTYYREEKYGCTIYTALYNIDTKERGSTRVAVGRDRGHLINSFKSFVSSKVTFPSLPTLATWMATGVTSGLATSSNTLGLVASSTAAGTTPASVSAISLTSSRVKTSQTRTPRLDMRIVLGPRNCRNSLSPQIDLLVAVLSPKSSRATDLYVSVSRMALQNRESRSGTSRAADELMELGIDGI